MGSVKIMPLNERRKRLVLLIADAKELGFHKKLIDEFETQLNEVEEKIDRNKKHDEESKLNFMNYFIFT